MERLTLVLNTGSSSVKFAVARGQRIFIRGQIEHFGSQAMMRVDFGTERTMRRIAIPRLATALTVIHKLLRGLGIVPTVVAHRIVHGGQRFSKPTTLTSSNLRYLHTLIDLAPLHQPVNLMGVDFAQRAWPSAMEIGVFDTALYRALPATVRTYALPATLTKRLHIEKYGFHGISHAWAFHLAAATLRVKPRELSAVTLHLGAGASMTLWRHGHPIDTTMGFTPLEGLVMSTRSGDIDPAIPLYIQEKLHWTARKVEHILEQHAGLIGLSGLRDMRDVLRAAGHRVAGWPTHRWTAAQRKKAILALDVFVYHVQKSLAGYLGMSDRIAAIVFTGPVGTNRTIQQMIKRGVPAMRGKKILEVQADEEQAIVVAVAK